MKRESLFPLCYWSKEGRVSVRKLMPWEGYTRGETRRGGAGLGRGLNAVPLWEPCGEVGSESCVAFDGFLVIVCQSNRISCVDTLSSIVFVWFFDSFFNVLQFYPEDHLIVSDYSVPAIQSERYTPTALCTDSRVEIF